MQSLWLISAMNVSKLGNIKVVNAYENLLAYFHERVYFAVTDSLRLSLISGLPITTLLRKNVS